MREVVVGVDLSHRGLGLCAVPSDWDLNWSRLETARLIAPLRKDATEGELIERRKKLAGSVLTFCARLRATSAWIESYPLSGRVYGLAGLCELGGVVKHMLLVSDCEVNTSPISSARKLVLGKLPRRDVKLIVHETIKSMGAPEAWSGDEIDAWVAANWGCSQLGFCSVAMGAG